MSHIDLFNWIILLGFLLAMLARVLISARHIRSEHREELFFKGTDPSGHEVNTVTLAATLLISWVMAKSVQNTADLGMKFGLPGGAAYATYWLAFIVAGVVIYRLRVGGFASIHHFLNSQFGRTAVWLFSLILLFRLWNEVWSNTMVVAQFFGDSGSALFITAAWITTALVLGYSLISGFRGSIITDVLQMALAAGVLGMLLLFIVPRDQTTEIIASGEWTLVGGVDLIFVALIQIFSYPFHDPVLTDRGFITEPKKMLRGFVLAAVAGVLFITFFSFIGIYNRIVGVGGNSTIDTARVLGLPALLMMNVMMLTAASSTLDSTFSSIGKLAAVDLSFGERRVRIRTARLAMVVMAVLGGAMVHLDPAILSATTVSGTMVIGLAPVFLLWRWKRAGPLSYWLSGLIGLACGLAYALKLVPATIGGGSYGGLLWINVVGTIACFTAFVLAAVVVPARPAEQRQTEQNHTAAQADIS